MPISNRLTCKYLLVLYHHRSSYSRIVCCENVATLYMSSYVQFMYNSVYNFCIKIWYFTIIYSSSNGQQKSAGSLDFIGFRRLLITYDKLRLEPPILKLHSYLFCELSLFHVPVYIPGTMYFTGFAVIFDCSESMPFHLHPPNFILGENWFCFF